MSDHIERMELRDDRDRARDAAVALEQENAAVTQHRDYLAQRLDMVRKEAAGRKAHGDRLKAELDAALAYVRRLMANRDAVARAVRTFDPVGHAPEVQELLVEIREAFAVVEGQRDPEPETTEPEVKRLQADRDEALSAGRAATVEAARFRDLVERALDLRMHGERALTGPTWRQWDRNAETALRADETRKDDR